MEMQTSAAAIVDLADVVIAHAEARQRRRRRWLIVGGIVCLLVSYPLSFGTVVLLVKKGMFPFALYPIAEVIYSPLIYVIDIEKMPMAEYLLRSYLWLFGTDL